MNPTAERVREILSYDAEEGIFRWRHRAERSAQWNGRYADTVAGRLDTNGYRQILVDDCRYFSSRLAWLYVTGDWVPLLDHKNGVRTDDRFSNLRLASQFQNSCNRGKQADNTSGYKGVYPHKVNGTWIAQITVQRKQIYLGSFATAEAAAAAYAEAARLYHGEFANTGAQT